MAIRIKVVKGVHEHEAALLILQDAVWHLVGEGTKVEMDTLMADYVKQYPFLMRVSNIPQGYVLQEFKNLRPGVLHKVSRRFQGNSPFLQF